MDSCPYDTDALPRMKPSIVCYADVLGFQALSRKALETGEGEQFLERVHDAFSEAHRSIERAAQGWDNRLNFSYQVFTDSLVVGYPYDPRDSGEPELGDIFGLFSSLQAALATKGFFLRGGIACGDHYMDQDVVLGEALLEAVEMDRPGGPPRLALADSAVKLVRKHMRFYRRVEESPHHLHLLQDADNVTFLNYLAEAFINFPDAGVFLDFVEEHQQAVTQGLQAHRSRPDVRAKFDWAARYHNYVCQDFVDSHPMPDIDGYPEYAAAVVDAQKTLDYLVDIESLASHPEPITFGPE